MIRFLKGLLVALFLSIPVLASADYLHLTDNYSNIPQYDSHYVGPIGGSLNGTPIDGGVWCDDVTTNSYFGSTFGVVVSTLADVSKTRFGSVTLYEEAVWLINQIKTNPGQVGPIQMAEWGLFNDQFAAGLDAPSKAWLDLAKAEDLSNYTFVDVFIYTPTECYASNQEFMSGKGIDPVPIPPTLLLLGSGLVGLVGLGKRKKA